MSASRQTEKSLKLSICEQFCDKVLARELFFTSFVAGSTRGGGAFLSAYMLIHFKAVPRRQGCAHAFLLRIARFKVRLVVDATRVKF